MAIKRLLEPATTLEPVPVVLVTTVDKSGKANICTIAWAGVACSVPPMISLAVRPERYTHELIQETKEFVANIPNSRLVKACDICGTLSGRKSDKFAAAGLTPARAGKVKAPLIAECPISLECKLKQTIKLGSHDLIIGEVVAIQADESVLDENGKLITSRVQPMAYVSPHEYWTLGSNITKD